MLLKYVCTFLLIITSTTVLAADPPIYSHKTKGAIKGIDVVAYYKLSPGQPAVKGLDEFSYEWKGATWKFSNEEHLNAFIKTPEAYMPQYGGYCAFALGHNFTTSSRPDSWSIIDGKLYLNHNKVSYKKFQLDTIGMIAKADRNWPQVLTKCEKRKKCRQY